MGLYKEIERWLFEPKSTTPVMLQKIITGCIVGSLGAGAWSHTDLIKTRMQLQSPVERSYTNTFDCFRKVVRFIKTCHVGTYDWAKSVLVPHFGEGAFAWICGGFASALVTTTISAPVDLVRNRIMVNTTTSVSFFAVTYRIIQSDGIRGLYRGWIPSFYRFGPHFTISWPLIELVRARIFNLDPF